MQNERKSSGINIGSASIIMVFSVLCLTVFAVLSLITANSEYELAVKSTDVIKNYYAADTAATEKLAVIKGVAEDSGFSAVQTKAQELGIVCESTGADVSLSFEEKVTDTQALSVKATYKDGDFLIDEWKLISTDEWDAGEGFELWDGEF